MWALKELKNTEGMSNDHFNDFSTTEYSFSEWKFINFEINEKYWSYRNCNINIGVRENKQFESYLFHGKSIILII